jgi:hypothetical protein
MARSRKSTEKKQAGDVEMVASFAVDVTEDTPVFYVNYAGVTHSSHDFSVIFGRMPAKPTPSQLDHLAATGAIRTEALLQLLVAPTMIPGLIRALTIQKEAYEARFGPIRDDGANDAGGDAK